MNLMKRMPLWGRIVTILIIILLLIGVDTNIVSRQEQEKVEPQVTETKSQVDNETTNNTVEEDTENEKPKLKPVAQTKQPEEKNENQVQETVHQDSTMNEGTSLGQFKITAYCNCRTCCGKWSGGPTASGVMPQAGRTIAVDPRVIPLGTEVIIDGHTYVAEDTGGAIKGNKIDMYFNSHSEALAWGVRYKEVVLK